MSSLANFMKWANAAKVVRAQTNPLTGRIKGTVGPDGNLLSAIHAARPSIEHGCKHSGARSTVTFDNVTMQLQTVVPAHFDAVKIIAENIHTSAYNTYFAVAASETLADAVHPVIGGAQKTSAGDWTHVTKSAAEPISSALGSANNPTFTESDWVALKSVDRTDLTGGMPILMVRAYTPAATGTITRYQNVGSFDEGGTPHETRWNALTKRAWKLLQKTGDFITTPSGFTGATQPNFCSPAFSVMLRTRSYGLSFAVVGDSLTEGVYTNGLSSGFYSYGYQAAELAHSSDFPVSFICQGWNGQTGPNFLINGKAVAAAMKPNVLLIPIYSPNDGTTQAALDGGFARAMEMAAWCRDNRIVPILTTLWPRTGILSAASIEYNAKARKLAEHGVLVLDVDAIVGTGDPGARVYAASYASGDGVHMNGAAHAAIAVELAKIITRIASSSRI